MVHYKLLYFPLRGLGEPIRLLFHYVGQDFEDERVALPDWPKFKPKTPFGHIPVLYIDGKELCGSTSICRYIAKQHNLAGGDNFEEERLGSIVDLFGDYFRSVFPYLLAKNGFANYPDFLNSKISDMEETKKKYYNELFVPNTKQNFPILVKLLNESGTGFFGKKGLSWVDFYIVEFINTFSEAEPETLKDYPELIEFKNRVYELPQIKNYVETRPKTPI